MFGLGEDFDIDEDFLDEVFQVEKASQSKPHEERLNINQNLEVTRLNILKESVGNSEFDKRENDSTFDFSNNINEHSFGAVDTPKTVVRRTSMGGEGDPKKIRVRKFPGPAGLLPERQINTSLIATEDFLNELEEELREDTRYKEEEVLSQESARRLESPAWEELSKDLGDHGPALLNRLNVAAVCLRAKQIRALKVPFLALLIQNVDASTSEPCLYLSDSTGEMVGAVHREVWEMLGEDLVAGAVIVLINVGVLCAGLSSSRHYLNITINNIAAVYSPTDGSDIRVTNMKPLSQRECSKFLQTWQEVMSSQVRLAVHSSPEPSQQLFSTASITPSHSTQRPFFSNRASNPSGNRSFEISLNSPSTLNSPIICNNRFSSCNSFNIFSPVSSNLNPTRSNLPPISCPQKIKPNFTRMPSTSNRPSNTNVGIKNQSAHKIFKLTDNTHLESKRPKLNFSTELTPSQDVQSQSVVESLLDGIDTDSLFGDF